jgi:hypothetical protein
MAFKGKIPKKDSPQWKQNEKIINSNPTLKRMRDQSEGFTRSTVSGSRVGGASEAYKDGWDRIFGNKDSED